MLLTSMVRNKLFQVYGSVCELNQHTQNLLLNCFLHLLLLNMSDCFAFVSAGEDRSIVHVIQPVLGRGIRGVGRGRGGVSTRGLTHQTVQVLGKINNYYWFSL